MGSQGSLGGIHGYLGGTDGTLGPMGPWDRWDLGLKDPRYFLRVVYRYPDRPGRPGLIGPVKRKFRIRFWSGPAGLAGPGRAGYR